LTKVPASGIPAQTRENRLEERILALAIKFPEIAAMLDEAARAVLSGLAREILDKIADGNFSGQGLDGEAGAYYEKLFMEAQRETIDERAATGEMEFHCHWIKKNNFKIALARLARELVAAEKRGDADSAKRLRDEFNLLSKSTADRGQ
jgi:hypothetical protein